MSEPQWKRFVAFVGQKCVTKPGHLAGLGPSEVLDDFLANIDGIHAPVARVLAADIVANRDEAERILAASMGVGRTHEGQQRRDDVSEPLVLNVPCEAGKAMGEQLARFYVQEKCDRGAEDNRCHDCAFRLGSYPNGCAATVMQALVSCMGGDPFYCHHGIEDGEPKRLCEGYKMLAD